MTDIITAVMWIAGSAFALLAAVGVLRMPDVFTRMQASTKASTLGLGCLLIGAALQLGDFGVGDSTGEYRRVHPAHHPVSAHVIARAAISRRSAAVGGHGARRTQRQCGSPARERISESTADAARLALRHGCFGYAEGVSTDEILTSAGTAIDWLERMAGDWRLLDTLPHSRASTPASGDRRAVDRGSSRQPKTAEDRESGRVRQEEAILNETGIRARRRRPVVTTPNVFPPPVEQARAAGRRGAIGRSGVLRLQGAVLAGPRTSTINSAPTAPR